MTAEEIQRINRLEKIIKYLVIKKKDFAESLGMRPQYISHLLNQQRPITISTALKIAQRYRSINPEWLLYGEGEMLLDEKPMAGEVKEAGGEYRISKKGDPLGALRTVLEDLDQRVRTLEAEVASLKKGKG